MSEFTANLYTLAAIFFVAALGTGVGVYLGGYAMAKAIKAMFEEDIR